MISLPSGLDLFSRASATIARLRGAAAPGAVILNYHSVGDPFVETIFSGNCLSKALFAAQMRFVRRYCHVVALSRIESGLRGEQFLPRRVVAVTFDDGYRGVLTNALPILERYEIPATIFLPTDWIATGTEKWDDRLSRILMMTRQSAISVHETNGTDRSLSLVSPADRLAALRYLCQLAPEHPQEATEVWVDEIMAQCGASPPPRRDALLSPGEVRDLSNHPLLTFGSHSASHRHLASLSFEELRDDLRRSRDQVMHWTNRSCRHFAYPYGREVDIHPRAPEIFNDLGFTLALTTIEGPARSGDDMFRLRRILAHPNDSLPLFELKALGAFERYRQSYESIRRRVRGCS